MAQHERHAWLVVYDIANPKRLVRVAKTLERCAIRLQYSVFLGIWGQSAASEALAKIRGQIQSSKDDVRAYRLPLRCRAEFHGRASVTEEMVLAQRGLELLTLLGRRDPEWLAERIEK